MTRTDGDGSGRHRHRGPEDRRRVPLVLVGAATVVVVLAAAVAVGAGLGLIRPSGAEGYCLKGTTTLPVLASPDTAPMLRTLGAEFSRTQQDATGRCIDVHVTAQDSAAATASFAEPVRDAGAARPAVWVPDASLWLSQLRRLLTAERRPTPLAAGASPSIATSPLVAAMPRPMAEALGWPKKPLHWSDLLRVARSPVGWSEYGHPEWGRFVLGETDPRTSQSGLEAAIVAYATAEGRSADLTLPDVYGTRARTFVAAVQQSVRRFSTSDTEYLADVRRADDQEGATGDVSALLTREELVIAYDRGRVGGAAHDPPKVPLVAVHPEEGVPVADHPYAVLKASWVGPRERAAAAAFLDWLRTPDVQRRWQDAGFRDAHGRAGAGAAVAGIDPKQALRTMAVPGPQVVSAILRSWAQLKKTANVLNLIDVSGSMDQPAGDSSTTKLRAASDAARSAMQLFTDDDEVGLWTFASPTDGGREWQQVVPIGAMRESIDGTTRRATLDRDLQQLRTRGSDALYRSVSAAYDEVQRRYRPDRINAVVLLSDGHNDDKAGGPTLDELIEHLRRDPTRPVRILTIAYGSDVRSDVLSRLAAETGGVSYTAPDTADIATAYASVLSNF